jgi:plastocyanin
LSKRSSSVIIPFVAAVVSGVAVLSVTAIILLSGAPLVSPVLIFLIFGLVFLGAGFGVWRRSRIGYVVSAVAGVVFIVLEGFRIPDFWASPSDAFPFYSSVILLPALLTLVVYSVLGFRDMRRRGGALPMGRRIPASATLALIAVGFIIGGAVVGTLAAGTESRLLASSGGGDITIVQGASNANNPQFFSPSPFTVKLGTPVTWVNKDGATHTVTSQGSNLFDSGNLPTGATFKFTFAQAGTYQYYCTIHPFMKGTVVVTSG